MEVSEVGHSTSYQEFATSSLRELVGVGVHRGSLLGRCAGGNGTVFDLRKVSQAAHIWHLRRIFDLIKLATSTFEMTPALERGLLIIEHCISSCIPLRLRRFLVGSRALPCGRFLDLDPIFQLVVVGVSSGMSQGTF